MPKLAIFPHFWRLTLKYPNFEQFKVCLVVYRPRYGLSQTCNLKNRSRLIPRKRKKGNRMSFKPCALLLKIGCLRGIKLKCAGWKNYLMTNFLRWGLFSSGGSTARQWIFQNFLNLKYTFCTKSQVYTVKKSMFNKFRL